MTGRRDRSGADPQHHQHQQDEQQDQQPNEKAGRRRVQATRNHLDRVRDLADAHDAGELEYVEAVREGRDRVYVIRVREAVYRLTAREVDPWLAGYRAAQSQGHPD